MIRNVGTRLLVCAVFPIAALVPVNATKAADGTRRTILVVDNSGSSTFTADQPSADAAARYVGPYVAALEPGHELRMISVGESGIAVRPIDIRAIVGQHRANSSKRLGAQFAGYFRALPNANIKESPSTSLIDFFESLEPVCATAPTNIIVFTDGIEWSTTVDGRAFARGSVQLPKPTGEYLSGCQVSMLGLGQLRGSASPDGLQRRLSAQWQKFLKAAGAAPVTTAGSLFDL